MKPHIRCWPRGGWWFSTYRDLGTQDHRRPEILAAMELCLALDRLNP